MRKLLMTFILSLCFLGLFTLNSTAQAKYDTATFAGGCFWCMEPPFEKLKGVVKVLAGYTGGSKPDI